MSSEEPVELRVAVFGDSGSGKTVLLSAFHAEVTSENHLRQHNYRLSMPDGEAQQRLASMYYALEDGHLPDGTVDEFSEHHFGVYSRDLPNSPVKLSWYDYPGGWLSAITEGDESPKVVEALSRLAQCQVGILLIDGQSFRNAGAEYVRRFLKKVGRNLEQIRMRSERHVSSEYPFPDRWIVALSKADMMGEGYTVKDFQDVLMTANGNDLRDFACKLGREDKKVAKHFMLLSALHDPEGRRSGYPTNKTVGLKALAPAILRATMQEAAEKAAEGANNQGLLQQAIAKAKAFFLSLLEIVIDNILEFVSFVPKKYRVIARVGVLALKALLSPVLQTLKAADLAVAETEARKRKNALDAIVFAMTKVLVDENEKSYMEVDAVNIKGMP